MAQQKVEEGMMVAETVVEEPLVERALFDRSRNGKTVGGLAAKDMVSKKIEDK